MKQGETRSRYRKGWIPLPDTVWKVERISKDGMSFIYVGKIVVSGKRVSQEMNAHRSIKGYEPYDIAQKIAHEKYPHINPLVVSQIWEE